MPSVIVDTSVLMDMLVASRPRHGKAELLRSRLGAAGIGIRGPFFALFETASAMKQEMANPTGGRLKLNMGITEDRPLAFEFVPIDEAFFEKYYSDSLPALRAGDLVFVAMARVEGIALITEDQRQREAAASAGVPVYSIDEYLAGSASPPPSE